jgi:glycosyltransferase involved in cell wall biosynthesis
MTPRALRILYLSQWFEPEPVMKGMGFVQGLIGQGHTVEVATGFPNYPGGRLHPGYKVRLFQREQTNGVTVNRLALYPSHDNSSWRRALNYLSFLVSATIFCMLNARRFDVIYVYHPPVTVGLAAALSGWFTRTPFVIDIQDLWPDSVAASGMAHAGRLAKILGAVCKFVYRRAATVVAQSKGMAAEIAKRAPLADVTTIHNWADETAFEQPAGARIDHLGFQGCFNIVYGGNLGRAQALDTLIEAAIIARRTAPKIKLHLFGDGVDADRLRRLADRQPEGNVQIRPPVSRAAIAGIFARADVLVLHLADDPLFEITIPSKLQFYLAAGKPVLIGGRGEAAKIVVDGDVGVAVPPDNPKAMADAMVALAARSQDNLEDMGGRARRLYLASFSFAAAIQGTDAVLRSAAAPRRGSSKRRPGTSQTAANL